MNLRVFFTAAFVIATATVAHAQVTPVTPRAGSDCSIVGGGLAVKLDEIWTVCDGPEIEVQRSAAGSDQACVGSR
jgi:hypothetical protein